MRFVTISIGSRAYGEMALNLAVSLRLAFPDCEIVVLSDGAFEKALGHEKVRATVMRTNEKNPFRLKCRLREHVQKAVYLDADSIVMNPEGASEWLESIRGQFFIQRMAPRHKPLMWAQPETIAAHHGVSGEILHLNSSLIVGGSAKLWRTAAAMYDAPMKSHRIGGFYPDEIPIAAACAKHNEYPVAGEPLGLPWSDKAPTSYPFISLAGAAPNARITAAYNGTAKKNAQKFGLLWSPFNKKHKVASNG